MFVSTASSEGRGPVCAFPCWFCEVYAGGMMGYVWKKPAVAEDGCRSGFAAMLVA